MPRSRRSEVTMGLRPRPPRLGDGEALAGVNPGARGDAGAR